MITPVNAKKGTGLGDLFKGYAPQQLEEQKKIVGNSPSCQTFQLYLDFLHTERYYDDLTDMLKDRAQAIVRHKIPVLSPSEIAAFLQVHSTLEEELTDEEHYEEHYEALFPTFINELIAKSYAAGHNDFVLNLPSHLRKEAPLTGLRGRAENLLRLRLLSDTYFESDFGTDCRYAQFTMDGKLTSTHDDPPFGQASRYCTFIVHGTIDTGHYGIHDYPAPYKMRGCVFKTSNKETYDLFLKSVPCGKKEKNQVYLIERDEK